MEGSKGREVIFVVKDILKFIGSFDFYRGLGLKLKVCIFR